MICVICVTASLCGRQSARDHSDIEDHQEER